MENQEDKNRKKNKDKSPSIPNHWEPVPGQALAAEEIARRIEAEDKEKQERRKKDKE